MRVQAVIKTVGRPLRWLKRLHSVEEILVLGDSHASVFSHWRFVFGFSRTFFNVCQVVGATASGLENPNSKTQAYNRFMQAVMKSGAGKIIVLLGEVDAGFVIWYRSKKYNTPVQDMLELTIQKYTHFLEKLIGLGKHLMVVSAPLPTITDGNNWGDVANLRKEVTATQRERTDLTLQFNAIVEKFCEVKNIAYIGLDKECLGDDGLVKTAIRNKNPCDHHYNNSVYAKLLIDRLKGSTGY